MRIAHPRWSHVLAAGLLLTGCKSNKDPEPAPKAQATAPAPKPAEPAPAPTLAPVSDATLSYVEELPDKKCRWVQHTPPAEPKTLTTTSSCKFEIAWKPDGKEALVSDEHGIWRVDLSTGNRTELPSRPPGDFKAIGFDAQGHTVALTEEPSKEDPTTGLTHAFRLQKDGTWTRFETKTTDFQVDDARGYQALDAFNEMAPTSSNGWDSPYEAVQEVPEDSPDLAALSARPAPSKKGAWEQLETAAGPLYVWEARYGGEEGSELLGPVLIRGDKGLVEPEGLPVSGSVWVAVRGDLVLLGSSGDSGKRVTRLWNAKTKKLLATLNLEHPVTFWPKFSSTPVRNLTPAGQLAIAFRAVYGSSSEQPPTLSQEGKTYELRPTALEWMGDTAVLLTSAEDTAGCHACSGAMSIHYLKPQGAGLAVKGSWPLLVHGSSNGSPPGDWKIRRDLGRNPFLTTRTGFHGQGQICESVALTELSPVRPIPRGKFFTHYDNEGFVSEGDATTSWTGRIARPVPDRSFEVVYSGSDSFTEHYQRQGEEYRREGESHFTDRCE